MFALFESTQVTPFPNTIVQKKLTCLSKNNNSSLNTPTQKMSLSKSLKSDFEKLFILFGVKVSGNVFVDIQQLAQVDKQIIQTNFINFFFDNYDKDASGAIDKKELAELVQDVGAGVGRKVSPSMMMAFCNNLLGELDNALKAIGAPSDNVTKAQFNMLIAHLNLMEEQPQKASAPASGYSKKIKDTIEGILRVFTITPSGNLYYDILVLLKEFANRQMDKVQMHWCCC